VATPSDNLWERDFCSANSALMPAAQLRQETLEAVFKRHGASRPRMSARIGRIDSMNPRENSVIGAARQ
jgi:hypothetical protein